MNIEPHTPTVSRRTILRGAGAALALPWLESMAWAEQKETGVAPGPPRRWATVLFANGVNEEHWWAKGDADRIGELSKTLRPLEPFKSDITVLEGLRLFDKRPGGSPHWKWFTNMLSGKEVTQTTMPDVGESLDHYMSRFIGRNTPVPMLNLGCERVPTGIRNGFPALYNSTVSWSSQKAPIVPEIYPRQAFDRLFDTTGTWRDRSVLDAVLAHAADVRGRISAADQHKLDRYMSDVRDVERRIQLANAEGRLEGWSPSLTKPNMDRPGADLPRDLPEHMKLMLDITVLAFQMDKTRIATVLLNNDLSEQTFTFLDGVTTNDIMHNISHHKNREDQLAEYQLINAYHVRQFAYMLGRMKSIDEGGSTLLDNTMLMFGTSMMDGNKHDPMKLPLILAGRGGGSIRPGRVLRFEKNDERRLCNLHVALLNRMGVPDKQFGNSIMPLSGLS